MQVIAAGEPRHAGAPEHLALLDRFAFLDVHRRQVPVKRLHTQPMIEDDAIAVDAEIVGVSTMPLLAAGTGRLLQ